MAHTVLAGVPHDQDLSRSQAKIHFYIYLNLCAI